MAPASSTPVGPLRRIIVPDQFAHRLSGNEVQVLLPCDPVEGLLAVRLESLDRCKPVKMSRFLGVFHDLGRQSQGQRLRSPTAVPALDPIDDRSQARLDIEVTHPEQALRLVIEGREIVITNRPRQALKFRLGLELVRAVAQQRRAVPLGLAAKIEIFLGRECPAVLIEPPFLALEGALADHLTEIEGGAVPRQLAALLLPAAPPGRRPRADRPRPRRRPRNPR